ncbi:dihydropteroate synthase [Candidatus Geothermarchaeota archaeon ex4572_27]|nr:MAG: dihydropteroate synthase [Candidatus Geothermarchaeota archaeon ex4572_27]
MGLGYIADRLASMDLSRYDCILIPGMIPGDASIITSRLGVPAYKGPKHAADLAYVLRALASGAKLSTTRPACEVLAEGLRAKALDELGGLEGSIDRSRALRVGRGRRCRWVGGGAPIRVVAEILSAPLLSDEELVARARRLVAQGADVVDVGMLSDDPRPHEVRRLVRAVRRAVEVPVSVDTVDEDEVVEAVRAGADMVISVTPELAERFGKVAGIVGFRRAAYVVVPYTPGRGPARGAKERAHEALRAAREVRRWGARKVIIDPLLDPPIAPGCFEALEACRLIKSRSPATPLMLGAGNVTELMDADSVGVNALLAALAVELGVDLLLTAEGSDKTRGSVEELAVAVRMACLARRRQAPPKDLGIDLLRLKEKRRREVDGVEVEGVMVVEASSRGGPPMDPAGSFKVWVDRGRGVIAVAHYRRGELRPSMVVEGRRAMDIRDELVERGLVSDLKHAFYLGYELAKAEVALKTGRSYVQDEPLF